MVDWLIEPLAYGFVLRGLIAGLLASAACVTLSVFVVWRGMAFAGLFALGILLLSEIAAFQDLSHVMFGTILGVGVPDLIGMTAVVLLVVGGGGPVPQGTAGSELRLDPFAGDRAVAEAHPLRSPWGADALNRGGCADGGRRAGTRAPGHPGGKGIARISHVGRNHGALGHLRRTRNDHRLLRIVPSGSVLGAGDRARAHPRLRALPAHIQSEEIRGKSNPNGFPNSRSMILFSRSIQGIMEFCEVRTRSGTLETWMNRGGGTLL